MSKTSDHILTVNASTENLSVVRDFVALEASKHGFGDTDIHNIRLAVDEAFTNIVKHAYNYDESKKISLKTGMSDSQFWISISDKGQPYDPTEYAEPNIRQRIKEGKRGGVGVYLIKKLMDNVEYTTIGNTNEIRMIKHL